MAVPRFYVEADIAKLCLYFIVLLTIGEVFILYPVQTYYLDTFVWSTVDLPMADIPYYNAMPTTMTTPYWVQINNLVYFIFLTLRFGYIVFGFFVILYVMGSKGSGSWIWAIPAFVVFLVNTTRTVFFWVAYAQCSLYAFCRSPLAPTDTTQRNGNFTAIVITCSVTFGVEAAILILTAFSRKYINKAVQEETDRGFKRTGSSLLNWSFFPSFYVPATDKILVIGTAIVLIVIYTLVAFWGLWYWDPIIWTSSALPYTAIPYYNSLDPWVVVDTWISVHNLGWWVVYLGFKVIGVTAGILFLFLMSGLKTRSMYPIVLTLMMAAGLSILAYVLATLWVLMDCVNQNNGRANWAVCTTGAASQPSFYYWMVWAVGLALFIGIVIVGVLGCCLKPLIADTVNEEKTEGVGGLLIDHPSSDESSD